MNIKVILIIFGILFVTGCSYITVGRYSYDNNPYKNDPTAINQGLEIFKENCASCHGASANGDGSVALQLKDQPANLLAAIETRETHEIANKVAYGHSRTMPAFRNTLSEEEIWKVANYVSSLKSNINK